MQVTFTVPEYPPIGATLTLYVAAEPGLTVAELPEPPATVAVNWNAAPVPERATVCGLPVALSAIDRVAERAPGISGLKLSWIVHDEPIATVDPQGAFCSSVNSPALGPDTETLFTLRLELPVLVSVTACGVELLVFTTWLPKLSVVVDKLAPGLTPVPVRLTVWGLPVALSETLTEPPTVPLVAGV